MYVRALGGLPSLQVRPHQESSSQTQAREVLYRVVGVKCHAEHGVGQRLCDSAAQQYTTMSVRRCMHLSNGPTRGGAGKMACKENITESNSEGTAGRLRECKGIAETHPSISSTSDLTFFFPLRSSGGPAIIDTPLALLLGSCHHRCRQEEEIRHSRVP